VTAKTVAHRVTAKTVAHRVTVTTVAHRVTAKTVAHRVTVKTVAHRVMGMSEMLRKSIQRQSINKYRTITPLSWEATLPSVLTGL
jgi:hypothetical protein